MLPTPTLFKIIQSELIKRGFNEFVSNEGKLIFFDEDHQFMTKIFKYDKDVQAIVDDLFLNQSLETNDYDHHFKKAFIHRFLNRGINRQTVESFKLQLSSTFLASESYINRLYRDLDKYIENVQTSKSDNKQTNRQNSDGTTTSDNRSAFADLPQNQVNIDVNSTVMTSASDNTISRNKQTNTQDTDGETIGTAKSENKSYQLDNLLKSNGLLDQVYKNFDVKCFLQVW